MKDQASEGVDRMVERVSSIERRFAAIVETLAAEPRVSVGAGKKGFGSSALKVGEKIFAMISSQGVFVVKLPKERVDSLVTSGAGQRFDPGHGRIMKEWLALEPSSGEDWLALATEAMRFVARQA
ncbi:MAG: hypothetical protein M3O15_00240 [Acidobacteriota bacterium]|nr:hypothetical protein [Acidobacteriota bacterium]